MGIYDDELVPVATKIPRRLYTRLQKVIPWGTRQKVIAMFLERAADAVEQNGSVALGALLSGDWELKAKPQATSVNSVDTPGDSDAEDS